MDEHQWDRKLRIRTAGRDAQQADAYRYPYEPTDYAVLQRLAESGYIHRDSIVVDYGCGKGRVGFFLNHVIGCRVIGVEYDERIYAEALNNQRLYSGTGVEFVCARAETFEAGNADCFYFFNPFSLEILRSVMGKLVEFYYEKPRKMYLFFYYPSEEYCSWLMTAPELTFLEEIDCRDLFLGSCEREKILVYQLLE